MLKDLVMANRSYRCYDQSHEIKEDILLDFINTVRITNSASNRQSLMYKIICKQPHLDELFAITKWGALYKNYSGPKKGEQPTGYIIICSDKTKRPAAVDVDTGIAAGLITLCAAEAGLGTCMIMNFSKDACSKLFSFPENITPVLVIAFGKPDDNIKIDEIDKNASTDYYRDEHGIHHVPKRKLADVLL